jgi:hypothetical protein
MLLSPYTHKKEGNEGLVCKWEKVFPSKREIAVPNDYEKFQEKIFDQLDKLEVLGMQRTIEDLTKAGHQFGIDVIAEIGDKRRSVGEVVADVRKKEEESKVPPQ